VVAAQEIHGTISRHKRRTSRDPGGDAPGDPAPASLPPPVATTSHPPPAPPTQPPPAPTSVPSRPGSSAVVRDPGPEMGDEEGCRARAGVSPTANPLSPVAGSRFFCLQEEDDDPVEDARATAEDAAWSALGLEPEVRQIGRSPALTEEEVEADFWAKIGFPTRESRAWSRATASKVSSPFCRSTERARSLSPSTRMKIKGTSRAASSSPVGLRIARMPRIKPWRGPLPRRRVTPAPVFGDFLATASPRRPAGRELLRPLLGTAPPICRVLPVRRCGVAESGSVTVARSSEEEA
jgi:hypothetical protein